MLEALRRFNSLAFEEGKLYKKVKEFVAVACTYITRCPYCMKTCKEYSEGGATKKEIAEVIAVAAALNAVAYMAHMYFAFDVEEYFPLFSSPSQYCLVRMYCILAFNRSP